MKKNFSQKGFTLVELLIAMTIFVSFVGILIGSYASIIRGQREADEYRIMYSESRKIFETIVQELRDGMVDYKKYNANDTGNVIGGLDTLYVVSKDASMQSMLQSLMKYQKVSGRTRSVVGYSSSCRIGDS